MPTLLFPGRHILNTRFQEHYLLDPVHTGAVDRIVFAITSANQSHSRYNPVPLHVRAVGVDRFGRALKERIRVEYRIVPVPHYAPTERFAQFLLKEVREATDGEVALTPEDTIVLSSTPELI